MKTAFLFPGQGSQYVGMGSELMQYDEFARTMEEADDILRFSLTKLCLHGPEEELTLTANAQPALFAVSVGAQRILAARGIHCQFTAGLSLGEYPALVAAGALDFAEGLRLVRDRGILMQAAAPVGTGGMLAVVGLDRDAVRQVCEEARGGEILSCANFNCPGQVVLTGHFAALERAAKIARQYGAKRTVMLPVSAPFHSELMAQCGEQFAARLAEVELRDPTVAFVSNVTAAFETDASRIRVLLARQLWSPVLWEESMRLLVAWGVERFVEVGAGTVLSGFMKRIHAKAQVLRVENARTLGETLDSLQEVC
ncbi:MAG: ACP S-malonyltransferase [Bacillota bacterium]